MAHDVFISAPPPHPWHMREINKQILELINQGVPSDAESRKSRDRAIESGARTWNKTSQKLTGECKKPTETDHHNKSGQHGSTPTPTTPPANHPCYVRPPQIKKHRLSKRTKELDLSELNDRGLKSDIDAANLLSKAS
ncbi:hypothetical protein RND71_025063 [Anisodus tanguticus]|uniref:Uncharacterized protein n=1 Tax=Anisodus tanguticus TaxID=243964 RepID=A0AAE1V5G5_9SOLA|nr:hypothetical protein RND71_025063 [Anisodus tanguticus]